MLGLVHAMRGAARQARPHLLESHLIATRIELVPMELFSSWGLCVLESSAGSSADAADRARQMLARLARTQERHYSVLILQWMAAFFAEQGMAADVRACAAALAAMAEATGQPEAIAALAHARGESLLADEPRTALRELRSARRRSSPSSTCPTPRPRPSAGRPPRRHRPATRPPHWTCCTRLHDTAGRPGALPADACAAALSELRRQAAGSRGWPRRPQAAHGSRPDRARAGDHAARRPGQHQPADRRDLVHQPAHGRDARPGQPAQARLPHQGRSRTPARRAGYAAAEATTR